LASLVLVAMVSQLAMTAPAHAQDNTPELRLRKLEAEVRALQRQVFPGGDTKFFPQDTVAPAPAPAPVGTPASSPMTDVLTRMDAVEAQVAHLTAQYEELSNHLRQMDARLSTVAPVTDSVAPAPGPVGVRPSAPQPAPLAATPVPQPAPVDTRPSAQRVAAVKAVIKPESGDPGEDEYIYGFKLWQAKFLPESEQQLHMFLDRYPRHPRLSYARNLLGRVLLDEGKPRDAAQWFLQNYKSDPHGARASDSLLYLAEAMVDLKDTNRACIALAEFSDSYSADAATRLKQQYDITRASVACN
jgi:TolA-binding protein